MPKKRKSRGRSKGDKGRSSKVQCDVCGAWVPRDKVIKVTKPVSIVDPQLEKELKKQGALIFKRVVTKNYCVSCAIFHGIVKVRSKEERKVEKPLS
ncbi:MAG: 30S ribosomal protein S26e [Candidatus Methanomethylicia archaeon]|jgi:small subunit ribosomal protein S26e|uniref:30S ribosomal protein S26e n=1 Tax=Thermoproteota archaeon TaxID=2056631 RepID=A0A523BHE3_9CREN|nr:30S ribosomal protein S26e [Candidatus Methanomethylicia archaeon]MCQ5340652.1 30S ribosomal protein S26e [Candidatus Methanomethylicia archaeon]NHV45917.1 30S ribosomal protein S26e [Candidatus Verstraetearchaeota archaeon]RZN57678.1 MAG: 30S ribosomal protein S26e [Candidatus Verstraetearchaeota archaeon]TDA40354.1 MAG: 30S ribosomal protein S26e [Candidatus Verstraetearchaeota archaeon]